MTVDAATSPAAPSQPGIEPRFIVRGWPDGYVLFDRSSGDTHALDSLAARLFASAPTGPVLWPEGVRGRLARLSETECEAAGAVEARARLTRLGLLASHTRME